MAEVVKLISTYQEAASFDSPAKIPAFMDKLVVALTTDSKNAKAEAVQQAMSQVPSPHGGGLGERDRGTGTAVRIFSKSWNMDLSFFLVITTKAIKLITTPKTANPKIT